MTVTGSYRDFERRGFVGSHYSILVHACPGCGYAAHVDDFKRTVKEETKKKVRTELKLKVPGKWDDAAECEAAAIICAWEGGENGKIADIYLNASYLLRGAKGTEDERRKRFQQSAADYFIKGLKAGEFEGDQRAAVKYLVGEMFRRQGKFEQAVAWYDEALRDPKAADWLEKIGPEQRQMAEKKDDDNSV
jgi:uncharacterized protein (DUF2225 family)